MHQFAVRLSNLHFSYPGTHVASLKNINLDIKAGERFGLFGPNGAGKTTLLSVMIGILRANHGIVSVFDAPIVFNQTHKKRIGFVPQELAFYPELSAQENLSYFGALYGLDKKTIHRRSEELLTVLGLDKDLNKKLSAFSGGMKRRINLAIGVMHKPEILFLDEPTVGVDVQTRKAIIQYLLELNKEGTTLIYTSHHLKEAEELCHHVALIDDGKFIVNNLLSDLLAEHKQEGLEGLFLKLTGQAYRD